MPQCVRAITFICPLYTEISAQRSLLTGTLMFLLVTELLLCSPESSLQITTPSCSLHHQLLMNGTVPALWRVALLAQWLQPSPGLGKSVITSDISGWNYIFSNTISIPAFYWIAIKDMDPLLSFSFHGYSPSALSYQIEFPHIKCPLFNSLGDIGLDSSHADTLCNTV